MGAVTRILSAGVVFFVMACQQGPFIRQVALSQNGLGFSLSVSPSQEDKKRLEGKLRIVNTASSARLYGNGQLALVCGGVSQVTRLDSRNSGNLVDSGLVTLMPGDTLEFFTFWEYPSVVAFATAPMVLEFSEPSVPAGTASADTNG